MTGSLDKNLLTIGHSNLPLDQFMTMLKAHNVTAIVDVRSVPFSRRFPWFSSRTLSERLQSKGIAYVMMGETLGGRPANPALYCDGVADYEAMASTTDFHASIDRVIAESARHRPCLMCSEREPLDCHRCLLVSRALAERGCSIGHILGDGSLEPHPATEERLLAGLRPGDDLFGDRESRLADAYRKRARRSAARLSDRVRPGRTPRVFSS
ncbi:MAG: DUF488 family protein [Rhizobiales bacterium]|nr:DUF488 family protein [Hyphomicrobiales bacterium]